MDDNLPPVPIELDCAPLPAAEAEELPPWRRELSLRLQEIKRRREAATVEISSAAAGPVLPFPDNRPLVIAAEKPAGPVVAPATPIPIPVVTGEKPSVPAAPRSLPKRAPARNLRPVEPAAGPPEAKAEAVAPAPTPMPPPAAEPEAVDIRALIDIAMAKPAAPSARGAAARSRAPATAAASFEDKLILLSRTLSGLIDLVIVVLFAGAFIITADALSGIIVLDPVSLIGFSALLLLIYFVYSLFFLVSANQTIGMMITDLKVVAPGRGRPDLRQIVIHCLGYLASACVAGIGLVWGCFDRDSRCLHDKWSNTRVVRV